MNTTENNKLIAEFMDFKKVNSVISESGKYFDFQTKEGFSCIKEQEIQIESEWGWGLIEQDFLFVEDLKFHNDWNWLMQVVEKIESLNESNNILIGTNITYLQIHNNTTNEQETFKGVADTKIEAVYNACVEFIKWYNEQPK